MLGTHLILKEINISLLLLGMLKIKIEIFTVDTIVLSLNMRSISSEKPMSNIRSASSSTKNRRDEKVIKPRLTKSIKRPGVATII